MAELNIHGKYISETPEDYRRGYPTKVHVFGRITGVTAYTDCTVRTDNFVSWEKHGEGADAYRETTVMDFQGENWYTVRVRESDFDYFTSIGINMQDRQYRDVDAWGVLKTEVSRGTGIVRNYVWIDRHTMQDYE